MIKSLLFVVLFVFALAPAVLSNYATPGTSVKWNLDDLVANSNGDVTSTPEGYFVNDTITITLNDTLYITSNTTVKFIVASFFDVKGTIIVNPPTGVLFTAQNTTAGYLGMRLEFSAASVLRKLTLEYAVSLRLSDCSPMIDSCIFQFNNNNASTSFGNGAIALFRASPVITNSKFLNNQRAAIQGGSNINNAPKIIGCLFQGNNTSNSNVPQINLGATSTGNDTVKILNNQILRSSTNSGGIGFLPIGSAYVIISGNVIKNNRYGISLQGGSSINAIVSYNVIDSNNTQANPNLGGSGIAFAGGAANSYQNSIVTGNLIRWNLWGITIQNRAKPNLGNLTNADTTDDGKNEFIENTNVNTPLTDLYNNTIDSIWAQNNYWNTADPLVIEERVFHKPDDAALGFVTYLNPTMPVELTNLTAAVVRNSIILNWQTRSESNSDYFIVERSDDGLAYYDIGRVAASGTSTEITSYSFTDGRVSLNKLAYYRLRMVDKDYHFKYSFVVSARLNGKHSSTVKLYPTILESSQNLRTELMSETNQQVTIQFLTADGKLITQTIKSIIPGTNQFTIDANVDLPKGVIYVRFVGKGINQTIAVIKH